MAIPVYGPVRARDLRQNISEMGFEKGVVHTVELLLEELSGIRQSQRETVDMLSTLIDNLTNVTNVAVFMREKLDEIERINARTNEQ